MSVKKPFKPWRKRQLANLIGELLTQSHIRKIQAEYSKGQLAIMQISQTMGVPPVLVYGVVTPIHIALGYKLREIPIETRINTLWKQGYTIGDMVTKLRLPSEVIYQHSFGRYSEDVLLMRKWYMQCYNRYTHSEITTYEETSLPPTSRLGWVASNGDASSKLRDVEEATIGRCPICGNKVYLPCLACRTREDIKNKVVPQQLPVNEYEEEEQAELRKPLLFT
jgi:hypothetical protein